MVVKDIPKVSHVHGVLAIPELGRVYASATGTDEVVAIDDGTLEITARVPAGHYPDGMAYAPEVHKLYVSDEHGNTETVIDVETQQRGSRRLPWAERSETPSTIRYRSTSSLTCRHSINWSRSIR